MGRYKECSKRKSFYWIVARIPDVTNTYRSSYISEWKLKFIEFIRLKRCRLPLDGFTTVTSIYDDKCNNYIGFKMYVRSGNPRIGKVFLFDGDNVEERNIKIL